MLKLWILQLLIERMSDAIINQTLKWLSLSPKSSPPTPNSNSDPKFKAVPNQKSNWDWGWHWNHIKWYICQLLLLESSVDLTILHMNHNINIALCTPLPAQATSISLCTVTSGSRGMMSSIVWSRVRPCNWLITSHGLDVKTLEIMPINIFPVSTWSSCWPLGLCCSSVLFLCQLFAINCRQLLIFLENGLQIDQREARKEESGKTGRDLPGITIHNTNTNSVLGKIYIYRSSRYYNTQYKQFPGKI